MGPPADERKKCDATSAYATGLGYTDATGGEGPPSSDALVHGAADATLVALKRLDGRPAKLVLVIESVDRHAMLGGATRAEWTAMRSQMDEATPCVGWLVEEVAAYGRGVQPTVAQGQLVVVELPASSATFYEWVVVETDRTFGHPETEYLQDTERLTWRTDGYLSTVGKHHVVLEYRHPAIAEPADTFSFTVVIAP